MITSYSLLTAQNESLYQELDMSQPWSVCSKWSPVNLIILANPALIVPC